MSDIEIILEEFKLSKKELAKELDVDLSQVYRWIRTNSIGRLHKERIKDLIVKYYRNETTRQGVRLSTTPRLPQEEKEMMINGEPIEVHKTGIGGEFVIHFLNLIKKDESEKYHKKYGIHAISQMYGVALRRAEKYFKHSKRFHNKSYGGGILIYNPDYHDFKEELTQALSEIAS